MHHRDTIAIRKADKPGWLPFKWEWLGDSCLVTGGVPLGVYKSGKRKGRPKWDAKNGERYVVTEVEIEQEEIQYATMTGFCPKCYGKGETVKSISVEHGPTYRPCRACEGTGKAGKAGA